MAATPPDNLAKAVEPIARVSPDAKKRRRIMTTPVNVRKARMSNLVLRPLYQMGTSQWHGLLGG